MKNKSFLMLIEQQIMIMVFAVAAAICIKTFVYSDLVSRNTEVRDSAVVAAQNAAQCLKQAEGDIDSVSERFGGRNENGAWVIEYGDDWTQSDEASFRIVVLVRDDQKYIGEGVIRVYDGDELVFEMPVSWQRGGRE